MSKIFQKISIIIFLASVTISCKKNKEEEISVPKTKIKLVEFGFNLHDFNVVHDTIQSGDTFGSILDSQNLNGKEVYDIVAIVERRYQLSKDGEVKKRLYKSYDLKKVPAVEVQLMKKK